jgi:hypothetical protein
VDIYLMKNCWKQLAAVPSNGKQKNKSGEKNPHSFLIQQLMMK